jgi:hypothetical protein
MRHEDVGSPSSAGCGRLKRGGDSEAAAERVVRMSRSPKSGYGQL